MVFIPHKHSDDLSIRALQGDEVNVCPEDGTTVKTGRVPKSFIQLGGLISAAEPRWRPCIQKHLGINSAFGRGNAKLLFFHFE